MLFSQRIGKKPIKTEMQIESIDEDLRNRLWNCLDISIWRKNDHSYTPASNLHPIFINIWHNYFKKPIDIIPESTGKVIVELRHYFFSCYWYEVYSFIEFVASSRSLVFSSEEFMELCNTVLEKEKSGYRFIEGIISPITSEIEIQAIEEAIKKSEKIGLVGVSTHLKDALSKLSDRKNPDPRNSIKESISAVESIAISISKNPKATLPDALKIIEKTIGLPASLKTAFSALYGYTSSSDGIRHALLNLPNVDFDDAKYMLVSCSAFVNYLISKCAKHGIKLK